MWTQIDSLILDENVFIEINYRLCMKFHDMIYAMTFFRIFEHTYMYVHFTFLSLNIEHYLFRIELSHR